MLLQVNRSLERRKKHCSTFRSHKKEAYFNINRKPKHMQNASDNLVTLSSPKPNQIARECGKIRVKKSDGYLQYYFNDNR